MSGVRLWAQGKKIITRPIAIRAPDCGGGRTLFPPGRTTHPIIQLHPCCKMAQEAEKHKSPYADDKLFYKNYPAGYVTREFFRRDHQQWLQEQGYMLRPRYHPDWKPSWAGTNKDSDDCEDGQVYFVRPTSL